MPRSIGFPPPRPARAGNHSAAVPPAEPPPPPETRRGFSNADLDRALDDVAEAMADAVDALSATSRGVARFHFGWADQPDERTRLPGKGLRARFCLLACALVGGDHAEAVPEAAAVELVHNFSLIYDDLMDGDEVRRGRAAVWASAGHDAAILTGVDIFAAAVNMLARPASAPPGQGAGSLSGAAPEPGRRWAAGTQRLAATVQVMVGGQYEDRAMAAESPAGAAPNPPPGRDTNRLPDPDRTPYPDPDPALAQRWMGMAEAKTGALFGCAMALGGLAAGAAPDTVDLLHQAGGKVGLAFQIIDDLIAMEGDPSVAGKPRAAEAGSHLYPAARSGGGAERCRADARGHLDEASDLLRSVSRHDEAFETLADLIRAGSDRNR